MTHRSLIRFALVTPVLALALLSLRAGSAAAADEGAWRQCRAMLDAALRLACYDRLPIGAAAAQVGADAQMPAAGSSSTFGMARSISEPDRVQSRIEGLFSGWSPGTDFKLANGQVWRIDDGTEGIYNLNSPLVSVKRGALGTFRMEIDGAGKAPRVKRVQ